MSKIIGVIAIPLIFFASTYLLGRIIGTYIFYDSCIAGGKFEENALLIGIECSTPLRIIFTNGMGLFEFIFILFVVEYVKKLLLKLKKWYYGC